MKIAFFGTGDFSKNILKGILNYSPINKAELKNEKIEVGLVVSQPDKIIGRKKILTPTPIKNFAIKNKIKILQPEKLKNNNEFFQELSGFDFIVVVAYGKIFPKEVLQAPKYGCINIHGSILPLYRGASPIQESIKNGDKETGLTIMYMSEGMDEGDILEIEKVKINDLDKTQDIFKKFEEIGPKLLINTLNKIISGKILAKKQNNLKATYCGKINKNDGKVFFTKNSASQIFNKFRAYSKWPGIYTFFKNKKLNIEDCFFDKNSNYEKIFNGELIVGKVEKINKNTFGIVCFDKKFLILKQIKLEGKKTMDINSFINGNKDFLNYKF